MPRVDRRPAVRCPAAPRLAALLATILLASLLVLAPTSGAGASSGDVSDYLGRVNGLRSSLGLAPLTLDSNLSGLAQAWAQRMADAGSIFHAPDLSVGVTTEWSKLGENVGSGPDDAHIFPAFVNSPAHYANLVDPAFTRIGIGVVWVGNVQFVVHRFLADGGGGGGGSAAPVVVEQPAPRPAVVATPATTPPTTEPAPDPVAPPATTPPAEPGRVAAVLDALHTLGA